MREDSELFLKKALEYYQVTGKSVFELNIDYFNDIPNVNMSIEDILTDLIENHYLNKKSTITDLEGNILIHLTSDEIIYVEEKKDSLQNTLNIFGGQVGIANDTGKINFGISETKKSYVEKLKRKISKKSKIIIISIIIIIFLTLLVKYYLNIYFLYNNYINDANYLKQNHNYLQAAEDYHNALENAKKLIFNQELYVKATCMEADCYLLLGFKEEDNDIAYHYYAKAGGIYGKIIDNKENKKTDSYIDALTGLSYVYNYSEHKLDKEWGLLIELIGEETKKIDKINMNAKVDDEIDDILLYRWIKIYSALGDYYYKVIRTDYSLMYKPTILNMALKCYENYDSLINLAREKDVEIATLINPIYHARIKAELMIFIALSPCTENSNKYAKQAIDLCQSYLNNASVNIGEDMESYISFRSLTADGYRILSRYYSNETEKSDRYMKKAYDELISLLELKSDKVQIVQMADIGYSVIFTGLCSDKDLKKILDNYQELLLQYNASETPKELAWYALNICDACKNIIEIYGYLQRAWDIGKNLSEEVKSIEEYVQKSQKKQFDTFYDYFHQDIENSSYKKNNRN